MNTSFLNPERVINLLALEEGMKVAEFGPAGTGYFAIEAARRVGRDGRVYAIDVQKQALEAFASRVRLEGLFNVEIIWADLEKPGSTKIAENSLDVVLIPNMLFQSSKKDAILTEARRILKAGGQLVIVDWIPEKAFYGDAMGYPVSREEMQRIAEGVGFTFADELQIGSSYHYGLVFRK